MKVDYNKDGLLFKIDPMEIALLAENMTAAAASNNMSDEALAFNTELGGAILLAALPLVIQRLKAFGVQAGKKAKTND